MCFSFHYSQRRTSEESSAHAQISYKDHYLFPDIHSIFIKDLMILEINGIFERVCCYFYLYTPIRWYGSLDIFIYPNYEKLSQVLIQNILRKLNPVCSEMWYTKLFPYKMPYSEFDSICTCVQLLVHDDFDKYFLEQLSLHVHVYLSI